MSRRSIPHRSDRWQVVEGVDVDVTATAANLGVQSPALMNHAPGAQESPVSALPSPEAVPRLGAACRYDVRGGCERTLCVDLDEHRPATPADTLWKCRASVNRTTRANPPVESPGHRYRGRSSDTMASYYRECEPARCLLRAGSVGAACIRAANATQCRILQTIRMSAHLRWLNRRGWPVVSYPRPAPPNTVLG